VAGALLLNGGIPGTVVAVPGENPAPELRIAPNFERFDGLSQPNLNAPATGPAPGLDYGGAVPRPGQRNEALADQVYTRGPLQGTTNTLGGQPLPVKDWKYPAGRNYTHAVSPGVQHRLGVGQRGPSELGAAQTVALGGITNNPPQPGDLSAIIAGIG
jgi:hypothetical protein